MPSAPTPSLGTVEDVQGPILLAAFATLILYGISVTQIYLYWITYNKDRKIIKGYVSVVFLADTLHTIFVMAYIYVAHIRHFGNDLYALHSNWLFASGPPMAGVIGSMVEVFYGWRVKVLVGNWFLFATIIFCAFVNIITAIAIGASMNTIGLLSHFLTTVELKAVIVVWNVAAIGADVLIMATLVYHLHQSRTGFQATDRHIDKIIRLTIQTGMLTVIFDFAHLITYLVMTKSPSGVPLFFNIVVAKLYSNALFSTLNSRGGWKLMDNIPRHTTSQSLSTSAYGTSQYTSSTLNNHPELYSQEAHALVELKKDNDRPL